MAKKSREKKSRKTGSGKGEREIKSEIKIEAKLGISGRSKGRGNLRVVPVTMIETNDSRSGASKTDRKGAATEHLFDMRLEEVTPAAKRIAAGDRLTALGSGPRLVLLSPEGVVGLASREASEAIRAALAEAPGASLESLATAVAGNEVSVSVTLIRATGVDGRAARADAQPVAKVEVRAAEAGRARSASS